MKKRINKDRESIIDAVLTSNPQSDWRSSKRPADIPLGDLQVRYLNDNVNLRFELVHQDGYNTGPYFDESWATAHSDPLAVRMYFLLYFGSTPILDFTLISVDGLRAALPVPKVGTLTVPMLDYKLAEIYMRDTLYTFNEYMEESGLSVQP